MARALVKNIKDVRRNYLINGDFEIWQRQVSFSATGFTADRWYATISGTATITRNTSAPPAGSAANLRYTSSGGASFFIVQALEDVTLLPAKGKVITASVKIKRNSTYDANFIFAIEKNATANTTTGGSWSTVATTTLLNAAIPTADYLTVSLTATVPNDGTANGLRINIGHSGSAANGSTLDVGQVMLTQSSVTPSEFQRAGASSSHELQLCQRYYEKSYAQGIYPGAADNSGLERFIGSSVVTLEANTKFRIIKRTTPAIIVYAQNGTINSVTNVTAGTTISASVNLINDAGGRVFWASGGTDNMWGFHYTADAEL